MLSMSHGQGRGRLMTLLDLVLRWPLVNHSKMIFFKKYCNLHFIEQGPKIKVPFSKIKEFYFFQLWVSVAFPLYSEKRESCPLLPKPSFLSWDKGRNSPSPLKGSHPPLSWSLGPRLPNLGILHIEKKLSLWRRGVRRARAWNRQWNGFNSTFTIPLHQPPPLDWALWLPRLNTVLMYWGWGREKRIQNSPNSILKRDIPLQCIFIIFYLFFQGGIVEI